MVGAPDAFDAVRVETVSDVGHSGRAGQGRATDAPRADLAYLVRRLNESANRSGEDHERSALDTSAIAGGRVPRAWLAVARAARRHHGPDECVVSPRVLDLPRHRRGNGCRGADAARYHAHPAWPRPTRGCRDHDRDDLGHDLS